MPSKRKLTFPFVPKSTAALVPGHFWALPLSDGSFGCARVMDLKPPGIIGARSLFLAAVLEWHAQVAPTSEAIAEAKCLDQGQVHLKAITQSGGCILGHRALELDHIEPWEFRGAEHHPNSFVYKGLQPVRPQEPADGRLPVLSAWGFLVEVQVAERRFIRGSQAGPRAFA
jgi:hypothetical protein